MAKRSDRDGRETAGKRDPAGARPRAPEAVSRLRSLWPGAACLLALLAACQSTPPKPPSPLQLSLEALEKSGVTAFEHGRYPSAPWAGQTGADAPLLHFCLFPSWQLVAYDQAGEAYALIPESDSVAPQQDPFSGLN